MFCFSYFAFHAHDLFGIVEILMEKKCLKNFNEKNIWWFREPVIVILVYYS